LQTSNKLHSNQQGFSPIIGIIAIVIVIGLAFGGWYVMQKQDDTKNNANQTNSQGDTPKDAEKDDTEPIADPTEDGKYLVIKEWGVRFEVPNNLKDKIRYSVLENKPNSIEIDTTDFPEGAGCPSFGVERTTQKVENSIDPEGFDSSSVVKLDDYYYSRITGFIACSNDDSVQQHAADVQRELYEATAKLSSLEQ
jgi:hypothetical protein